MQDDLDNATENKVSRRSFLFTLVGVTCLGLPLSVGAYEDFKPFSFGYVTDAHLVTKKPDSFKLLQQSQLFLQDCIKTLNGQKLDFVIFGGDQVETPGKDDINWNLFLDVVQILNCPWSFVLGETDVSGDLNVNKMKTFGPDWKGKGIETDKPYWSQSPMPNVHLIGLDTSRPNTTTGEISQEQLDWLKSDLTANAGKFTIVFSHHPLLAPPPFDTGPPWDEYIANQGDSAREILNRSHDVRLAVSGHLHVSKIQRERDIWYVSSPSLDVYPCAFRIFRVRPESITVETYQVTFPALVKKARQLLDSSNLAFKYNPSKPQTFADLCAGQRQDQFTTLPLKAPAAVAPVQNKKVDKKKEKEERKEQERKEKEEKETKKDKEKESKSDKKDKKEKEPKGKKGKQESEPTKEPDTKAPEPDKTPADTDDVSAPTKAKESQTSMPDKAPDTKPDKGSADKDAAPPKDASPAKATPAKDKDSDTDK